MRRFNQLIDDDPNRVMSTIGCTEYFVAWASSMIKFLTLPNAGTQICSTKYSLSSSFLSNYLSNPRNIFAGVLKSLEASVYASMPRDGITIPSDAVISYKRRRQDPHDGVRTKVFDKSKEGITEIMVEPVLEEYIAVTRKNYTSGNNRGKIIKKSFLELKGTFLIKICNNAFSGTNGEYAIEHIEKFLEFYPPSRTNKEMKADKDEVSWDQHDNEFGNWLASKFENYMNMDRDTMIETNIFDYESPVCKAFNEFNYIFQIDPDVLTKDILEFKTYEDYKDDWIYEWNDKVPWVNEKHWKLDGVWKETICDQGDATNIEPDVNYNTCLDIARLFNDHTTKNEEKDVQDGNEEIKDLDDYLVRGDAQFNKDDERRCKLLGIPYAKPSACKTERFEVVKYSFGPSEKYVAIKECGYYDWTTSEENVCHAYQDIFHKMDEGWFMTRAEKEAEDKSNLKTLL
ncbi:hypothetical protein Tco_1328562 [Tanacetum coccineum]